MEWGPKRQLIHQSRSWSHCQGSHKQSIAYHFNAASNPALGTQQSDCYRQLINIAPGSIQALLEWSGRLLSLLPHILTCLVPLCLFSQNILYSHPPQLPSTCSAHAFTLTCTSSPVPPQLMPLPSPTSAPQYLLSPCPHPHPPQPPSSCSVNSPHPHLP